MIRPPSPLIHSTERGGKAMESHGESFLRQLSVGSSPSNLHSSSARGSRRWRSSSSTTKKKSGSNQMDGDASSSHNEMRLNMKKRVMVVIDESSRAKHAMVWALTHIANKGDHLTLLYVVPPPSHHHSHSHSHHHREDFGPNLANSLGSLCKSCKPEVIVQDVSFLEIFIYFLMSESIGTNLASTKRIYLLLCNW